MARPLTAVERDVAVQANPQAVQEGGKKPRAKICIECVSLSTEVVVRLVKRLELRQGWNGRSLFQAAGSAEPHLITAIEPKTCVEKSGNFSLERTPTQNANSYFPGDGFSLPTKRCRNLVTRIIHYSLAHVSSSVFWSSGTNPSPRLPMSQSTFTQCHRL